MGAKRLRKQIQCERKSGELLGEVGRTEVLCGKVFHPAQGLPGGPTTSLHTHTCQSPAG